MTPPTTTLAPSSIVCRSSTDCSTLRLSAASTPNSGWSDTYRPEHLLLVAELFGLVEGEFRNLGAFVEPVASR